MSRMLLEQVSPIGTFTGFKWADALRPPAAWTQMHADAEAGGYVRKGRRWTRAQFLAPWWVACTPVRQLYSLLIARVTAEGAASMGYTVDA